VCPARPEATSEVSQVGKEIIKGIESFKNNLFLPKMRVELYNFTPEFWATHE
jgi:hypothetical protein